MIDNDISSVRKVSDSTDEAVQPLVDKEHSKLFAVDMDQIFIFLAWYQYASHNNSALKEIEIMNNITVTEWEHFCNSYIGQKTYIPPLIQTITGIPSYRKGPKLKVSLK